MSWSNQQEAAIKSVRKWLRGRNSPQVFRLFGFAGTGKSTLARAIADDVKGAVRYCAFTGKAALVMQRKGCAGAQTVHSLIYRIDDPNAAVPMFILNPDSPVANAKLVILDECSMIDADLGGDLLSFGTKVLVLGDPAQLPPVKGAGFFTADEPDVMLTEIHRQARDNPIIRLSMDVREGRPLHVGAFGESKIMRRADLSASDVLSADQALVGKNITRRTWNERIRGLKGFTPGIPSLNDRLVCLRNNRGKGLLNGGIWTVEKILGVHPDKIKMHIKPDDAGAVKQPTEVGVHPNFFSGRENELEFIERRDSDEFDFGYALTVHKSQGSQWNHIILYDEGYAFREDRARWLYTGVTRAAQKITVVQ